MVEARRRRLGSEDNIAYLMILPFFLLFTVFVLLPILISLGLSFTDFNFKSGHFVGVENYVKLWHDPLFWKAFRNTLVYTFFNVVFIMVLSFFLAVALNRNTLGIKLARSCMYIPHVTSMVAVSVIWLWLYEPTGGVFNQMLTAAGLPGKRWLLDPATAMACVIVMSVWKSIGYNMVLFLAGLQGIPGELYEAADIDGATRMQKIIYIILPMLSPVTFFVFITNTIGSFNVFESVNVMTRGGPMNATTTLVHQIYTRSFTDFKTGYGSAIAMVLTVVVLLLTLLSYRFGNMKNDLSN